MRSQYFPSLFLLAAVISSITSASAIPLSKRLVTPDTLAQDITNIHNGVVVNQQATANYQGGNVDTIVISGAPVFFTIADVHVVNRKGFTDANLSGPIDELSTAGIIQHTVDTVGQSIPTAINILVGKKEAFVMSGQGGVVIGGLELLLNDHDTFSAALLAKLYNGNADLNTQGLAVVAKIHNAIQSGIDAYSS